MYFSKFGKIQYGFDKNTYKTVTDIMKRVNYLNNKDILKVILLNQLHLNILVMLIYIG